MSFAQIFNGLKQRLLVSKEDMNPEVIKQIQIGAKKTKNIPEELKSFFDYF